MEQFFLPWLSCTLVFHLCMHRHMHMHILLLMYFEEVDE